MSGAGVFGARDRTRWGRGGGLRGRSRPFRAAGLLCLCAGALPAQETSRDYLTIEDHPARQELVLSLGPIDLPPRTSHHDLPQIPVQEGTAPFDFAIAGYRVEAVDGDGRPVPQTVIHHMNVLDPGRRELFLPIMMRLLAAGRETPPYRWPGWLFGFPVEGGSRLLVVGMLHNPTEVHYRGVRVRMAIRYTRDPPLYRAYPFHVDVMFPTGSKAFDLPPGRTVRSWEGSPAIPGGIAGLGGHLHRYATELELEDVTAGRTLYRVRPETDATGGIREVPAFRYGGPGVAFPIHPDHRYRVTVTYFNPTRDTIAAGGMGAVAGGFIPFVEDPWPPADPRNVVYARDYAAVVASRGHGADRDHGAHGDHGGT